MFIFTDKKQIEDALERARKKTIENKKPKIKVLSFGHYLVESRDRTYFHEITCKRDPLGRKIVSCDCKTRDGLVCQCGAIAIGVHIVLAEAKQNNQETGIKIQGENNGTQS